MNSKEKQALDQLIEDYKYIWEVEHNDHILVKVYDEDFHIYSYLCRVSDSTIYEFNPVALSVSLPTIVWRRLQEAGAYEIDIQLNKIRESRKHGEDWIQEALEEYEENQRNQSVDNEIENEDDT